MKPLVRGYIHQAAFFISLCACAILIIYSNGSRAFISSVIYSISLVGMFGISSLYHVPEWDMRRYKILRRIDHAAIYVLIAGSATPICLLGLQYGTGQQFLFIIWLFAVIGIFTAPIWAKGPKPFRASLYVAMGWLGILYYPEIKSALDNTNVWLLVTGGVIYTAGAMIYAFKWPDPFPRVFGYHEIFHALVVIASGFHFCLNFNLITQLS